MKQTRLILAAVFAAGLFAAAPAFAQHGQDPLPAPATENPSGQNPTADAPTEQQLLNQLQGGRLEGRVSIPDHKSAVLEQPAGRFEYRAFREEWLPWIGGIAIIGMLIALFAFYFTRGRITLEDSPESGRKILRFTFIERLNHWMTATAFILLALTGLNYIFGKRLIFPLIGPDAFAVWSQYAKYVHNFVSWPFMVGLVIMILVWIKDNVPSRVDWVWIKQFGGFIGGKHPPARRFNAGQKVVFWSVVIGGLALSATGIIMLFPFTVAGIEGMQIAMYIHATVGVLLIAVILAHIYIGSLGMEGAYDAMGSGEVDLGWAKTHHSLWVEEEQAKTIDGPQLGPRGAQPAE
ncbi:formate dehydrogenase subunit gamma [Flaviflagellibacter deserti]|jgi:formate dehydrogenase subunit gamma|uniref:Formate dehydrogenase subunit gamma n=1 Tax=Flaviflagellibacter deserti TaxID=2267266 RepID=A0ABV9Z0X5_9HYPH